MPAVGVDPRAVARLRNHLFGDALLPGDRAYDDQRRIWNGVIDRSPAAIVRCLTRDDVRSAIGFGREVERPICVRGGGHAVAGYSVADDAVMVDLSAFADVRIDPDARVATVLGGALWGDVDAAAQAHGLAFTGGIVSHTGVAGLTLGGGIGWLMRKTGLTIDSLRRCKVVTAAGDVVYASESEEPDLFWALRGGGGNFGVVTEFEFELHAVGPTVVAGMVGYPLEAALEVVPFVRELMRDAPDELGVILTFRRALPLPFIPEELHGQPIVGVAVCHVGAIDAAEEDVRALRSFGRPAFDTVAAKPYLAHQQMFDAAFPHFRHYYWKSRRLPELADGALEAIVAHSAESTSTFSATTLFTAGGAVGRVDPGATAYPHREALHDVNVVAAWEPDDPDPARHVEWSRGLWRALEPYGVGVYVNFISDEMDGATEIAFGTEKYARLLEVKRRFDPDNLFRFNANIAP